MTSEIEDTIEIPSELGARLRGRLLIVTGAGVSAESGIPTFRGRDGYWRSHNPMTLATPEAFAHDPALVWEWYAERRARIRAAQPNAGHDAIVQLLRQARESLLVTQNVDDLHERAGAPGDRLVHIHGEILITRCSRCAFARREEAAQDSVTRDDVAQNDVAQNELAQKELALSTLPRCPSCDALLRPGVVWFGESLDPHQIARIEHFFTSPIDLVIAAGTTATFPTSSTGPREAARSSKSTRKRRRRRRGRAGRFGRRRRACCRHWRRPARARRRSLGDHPARRSGRARVRRHHSHRHTF